MLPWRGPIGPSAWIGPGARLGPGARRRQRRPAAQLALACLAPPATAATLPPDPGPFALLRADESCATPSALAQFPLGAGAESCLRLGLDVRERYQHVEGLGFGLLRPAGRQDYLLSRAMADADLHLGRAVRLFFQLTRQDAPGNAAPLTRTDVDAWDVGQLFVDLAARPAGLTFRARIGRQELLLGSGRFVDVREVPNIRQSHDGVRVTLAAPGILPAAKLEGFVVRPVLPRPGGFDDTADPHHLFAGLYASDIAPRALPTQLDAYWFHLRTGFSPGPGFSDEARHTIGLRAWGRAGCADWDADAVLQRGSRGRSAIAASGLSINLGCTLAGLPAAPRLSAKLDLFSGGAWRDGADYTGFAPLFPRGPYWSEPGLTTFSNLISVFPNLTVTPTRRLVVQTGVQPIWRASRQDAAYVIPRTPLPGTATAGGTYVGTMLMVQASWLATPHVLLNASLVHAAAGPVIQAAGGRSMDYAASWISVRY